MKGGIFCFVPKRTVWFWLWMEFLYDVSFERINWLLAAVFSDWIAPTKMAPNRMLWMHSSEFQVEKMIVFFGATAEITQPDLMEHCCHEYAYLLVRCGFAGFTAILSTALSRRMKCFHQNNLLTRVWINFTALIQFPARPPLVVQRLESAAYANELIFISFNDASWMSV